MANKVTGHLRRRGDRRRVDAGTNQEMKIDPKTSIDTDAVTSGPTLDAMTR
jgi:hypothetical protein